MRYVIFFSTSDSKFTDLQKCINYYAQYISHSGDPSLRGERLKRELKLLVYDGHSTYTPVSPWDYSAIVDRSITNLPRVRNEKRVVHIRWSVK